MSPFSTFLSREQTGRNGNRFEHVSTVKNRSYLFALGKGKWRRGTVFFNAKHKKLRVTNNSINISINSNISIGTSITIITIITIIIINNIGITQYDYLLLPQIIQPLRAFRRINIREHC